MNNNKKYLTYSNVQTTNYKTKNEKQRNVISLFYLFNVHVYYVQVAIDLNQLFVIFFTSE